MHTGAWANVSSRSHCKVMAVLVQNDVEWQYISVNHEA